MHPQKYPATSEAFRVHINGQALPTWYETREIALQALAQLQPGAVAQLERCVISYTLEQIYGTSYNPLPQPPAKPIPVISDQVVHVKKAP